MNKALFIEMISHLFANKAKVQTPAHVQQVLLQDFGAEKAHAFVNITLAEALQYVTISDVLMMVHAADSE